MISIVLATYNEQDTIRGVIDGLLREFPGEIEVVVVDDDSPDGTGRTVASLGRAEVKLIRRRGERGLASALRRGAAESAGEFVGWMDADGGMHASLLREMRRKLVEEGFDAVFGSRYLAGGADGRPFWRGLASRCVNHLARALLDPAVTDYTSGLALMRRSVLERLPVIRGRHGEHFIELKYRVRRLGYKVAEIGYRDEGRKGGTSKSTASVTLFARLGVRYAAKIASVFLRGRFLK